jgi:hypothetical protein
MLEYLWIPQEQKDHQMQVCEDLLNHEQDAVSPLQAEIQMTILGVTTCEFPIKEKVGKVMCTVFWDRKDTSSSWNPDKPSPLTATSQR